MNIGSGILFDDIRMNGVHRVKYIGQGEQQQQGRGGKIQRVVKYSQGGRIRPLSSAVSKRRMTVECTPHTVDFVLGEKGE